MADVEAPVAVEETVAATEEVVEQPATDAAAAAADTAATPAAGEKVAEKQEQKDLTEEEKTKLERAIIRQVEYYFGDANLNRDKFLLAQIAKDEEGWVPLSVLITFKRLAELSTDFEVIVNSLYKSDESLIEISDDKQKVRRHPERPLPEHNEERRKEIQSRTAYAKGFPLEADINELLEFFSAYEKVLNITLRKYLDKPTKSYKFKGSVFATFETKEQAQNFIEQEKIVYKERELLRKWQQSYFDEKREEAKTNPKKNKKNGKEQKEKPEPVIVLAKNAIIHFAGAPTDSTREQIREALEKTKSEVDLVYIDFSRGQTEGYVRLSEEDSAKKYLELFEDAKVKFNDDVTLTLRLPTEEEENTVLEKAIEFMKKRREFGQKRKNSRFGNKRKHFGNSGRNNAKKSRSDD